VTLLIWSKKIQSGLSLPLRFLGRNLDKWLADHANATASLGFIREQTGSIKPTVALHASYNSVIVAIALLTQ
jgi:hypothetical protein